MIQKKKIIALDEKLCKTHPHVDFTNPNKCYYHLTNNRCKKGIIGIEVGDEVTVGQVIGQRDGGFFKQNIHSTISGKYTGNEKLLHRTGKLTECIVIENDFKENYSVNRTNLSFDQMLDISNEDFIDKVRNNSNVGLGGSGFPTYIKLESKSDIQKIIINGVECEPYLTSDVDTMFKYSSEIISGLFLLIKFYSASEGIIAVKKKQKKLITVLQKTIDDSGYSNIKLVPTENYYPQGYEKDLVKTVTNITVPATNMPAELGFMVFNSTSVLSIYKSLRYNSPILTREISAIGTGLNNPTNLTVKVGTSVLDIIDKIGGYKCEDKTNVFIAGGPMMGQALKSDNVIVSKAFSTFLVLDPVLEKERACINCGSCIMSCPSGLQPVLIMNQMKNKNKEALIHLNVKSCIECGLCSYVCTSKIDLTKHMRKSKRMI